MTVNIPADGSGVQVRRAVAVAHVARHLEPAAERLTDPPIGAVALDFRGVGLPPAGRIAGWSDRPRNPPGPARNPLAFGRMAYWTPNVDVAGLTATILPGAL